MLSQPDSLSSEERESTREAFLIPKTYLEARTVFLERVAEAQGGVSSYQNPCSEGADGESLYCDIAQIGLSNAQNVILISSGTHGVEGYCGSALQSQLLRTLDVPSLPANVRVAFVHALNPFGFSHTRRTTEENVDLNRNFVDFSSLELSDPQYQNFRNQIFPDNWHSSDLKQILERVDQFIAREGESVFQALMTKGQYSHPQDPYFGGQAPTWSNRTWSKICKTELQSAENIVHIDLHSGLGEFGACEVIYTGPHTETAIAQAKRMFGENDVIPPGTEESLTPNISGPLINGLHQYHPNALGIALEFGTVPIGEMLRSVILATWLHHNPDCDRSVRAEISKSVRQAFCSDNPTWISSIWQHTVRYVQRAVNGLKEA